MAVLQVAKAVGPCIVFFNITDPSGDVVVTPHGPNYTFRAAGTSPVPTGSHYAYVRGKHIKMSDLSTIPAAPPADAALANRIGSTNNWEIPTGHLIVNSADLNVYHAMLSWNFVYTGSTIAVLSSIDISLFRPIP
jgi:hypothetical protein